LDRISLTGLNLYAYCYNNPVIYVDRLGNLPKWLAWTLSGLAIVSGLILCATGVGGILGGVLLGAGAGSLINGYVTEASGGDFTAGYIGGAISGAFCAVGAGIGGLAIIAASEAVGMSVIGLLALGIGVPFAGGVGGNIAGTIATYAIDPNSKISDINWSETIKMATLTGALNGLIGIASSVSTGFANMALEAGLEFDTVIACRLLAGIVAGGTEAVFDLVTYLINKLLTF